MLNNNDYVCASFIHNNEKVVMKRNEENKIYYIEIDNLIITKGGTPIECYKNFLKVYNRYID